jgi:filamentous hemagglutinin family protein
MNCSYRSLWNDSTGTFVAVSENARSAGKKTSAGITATGINARFTLQALAVSVMLVFGANALAQPAGGVVAAGAATISTGATNTTINQSTQNAIINWQSFSIAAGQSVQFIQPNSSSVTLNRVLGSDPSSILGSLSANGKVFLVNPNGILFGQGASVNVGGLLASTLNIADSDFLAGNYKFSGNGTGSVLNQGSLNADGGSVALLGAKVSNEGVISAQLGSVVLAAGNVMTMDMAGDGLLNVAVNEGAVNALVHNGGLIRADGGQVLLTAKSAGSLLQSAVNNTGVVQAQTLVTGESGSIMLMGDMQSGTVNVGGTLDASAPNGGDGGFIETSAAHVKIAEGTLIRTQSAQGKAGTWLIDPVDFTIASSGGDITPADLATALAGNVIISSENGGTGTNGDINVNNDVTWGAATTLTLNAVNDVNFNAAVTATNGGSLVANAGRDIAVAAGVVTGITTTGGNITWTAGQDIQVNTNLAGQTGITATFAAGDSGNITWIAGRDVNINSEVTATGGDFTVCCGRDIKVNDAVTTTDGDVSLNAGRDIVITAAMTTTRGDVLLRAGSEASAAVPGLIGGTVVFATTTPYTINEQGIHAITVDYTPTSYATPNDYSGNFTGATLTQHMLVFAEGNDKVYDGNTDATLTFRGDPTVGGTLDVTLTPGTGTFDDKNVAPDIGISFTGLSLGGADAAQFALWGVCGAVAGTGRTSAAITPAPLTLQANNATKVYGTTFTPANTAFTTPVAPVAGETVTSVIETSTGSAPTASVAGSTYPIVITPDSATGANGFVATNYTITYLNGALTVTPAPLTITANDATKVYGQAITLAPTAFTTTALVNGETVGTVTEVSPGTVATAPVAGSPYAITPSDATGGTFTPGNYTIDYVNGVLTVTPTPLTITANDASKTYGQTLVLPDTAFTTTGLVNGDTVTSVPETSAGTVATAAVVGSPYAITPGTATGTYDASNYTVSYVDGKLYVLPVVVPPVDVPPDAAPDGVTLPDTPLALPIVNPPVGPRAWPPGGVLPLIPPQLQTLTPSVALAPPAPVEFPVAAPREEVIEAPVQPQLYVAPIRPRKQDRN